MTKKERKELFEAKKIVYGHKNFSISFLQRKMKTGYNRAAMLINKIKRI
jgi:DNA segregation ATPase FtsK/SpoIIIE-like protein